MGVTAIVHDFLDVWVLRCAGCWVRLISNVARILTVREFKLGSPNSG
jgi:hypothetical protein